MTDEDPLKPLRVANTARYVDFIKNIMVKYSGC